MSARQFNPLWFIVECFSMCFGLGLFALICLGSVPVFIAMFFLIPKKHHRRASRGLISVGFRCYLMALRIFSGIFVDGSALKKLNAEKLVIVANHPSLLDAVILFAYFPNACCIIKASLLKNILFGVGARMAGYISNQDACIMMLQARKELEQGGQLIIFPESGRTRSFPISEFSTASCLISKVAGAPIQCILLDFSTPYLGKDWGLFNPPVIPLKIKARIGRQMAPVSNSTAACQDLHTYFRNEVRTAWIDQQS